MKTIDTSLNLKIKENDDRIKALIKHNTTIYFSTNPHQQKKNPKISNNNFRNNSIHISNNHKQKILPKTMTTKDIGLLSTNPNTNSQSASMTSLYTHVTKNYNRSTITHKNDKIHKILNFPVRSYNYRNSKISNKIISKTSKNNENLKKKLQKKNKINLNEMIERFKLDQNKKHEKLEKLKQIKEEKENQKCSHKPKLNQKTKNIMSRTKTDFFARQSELEQRKKQNEIRLKEILHQKEQDKIFNSSYIYQKKLKESSSKGGLSNSMISDFSNITRSKKEIDDGINRLLVWGEQRKKRLSQKIEEKNTLESKDHVPIINKRSSSLAHKKNTEQKFYLRLSKEDETIKEKNRLLADILTPTFKPSLFLSKHYGKGVREKKAEADENEDTNNIINISNSKNSKEKSQECNSSRIPVPKKNGKNKFAKISQLKEIEENNLHNNIRNIVIKHLFKQSKIPKVRSSITLDGY